ncbi:MAG: glycosyltransferase family 39 protein [Calothrix sp. CSU_2_0]|nr:glycosyltransferase family 39 protein [Calothrix sp. CSU_2_0]
MKPPSSFLPPPSFLPYLSLLMWAVPIVLMRSGQQSLMAHDEGIYATQAKAILQTGDWVTVQWGGEPGFDRTIGIQWLIAVCYLLFGVHEGTARLPSAIAFILSVLLIDRIGCRLLSSRLAWLGAAIFSVIPIVVQYGRLATQDSVLVCIELVAIWALLEGEAREAPLWGILAGSMFGLGFLVKGFMIIPAAIALLPYLIAQQRRHRHLTNPWLYAGLLLGLVPVGVWLGLAIAQHGSTVIDELFGKLFHLKQQTYQGAGPFYYFWNVPANGFPWVFFALAGIGLAFQNAELRRLLQTHHSHLLLMGYPIVLFVELTLFGTRTHYYPLQLMPFVGLLAAIALDRLVYLFHKNRQYKLLNGLNLGMGGLAVILLGTGVAVLTRTITIPGVPENVTYLAAIVTLFVGFGWLILPIVWLRRYAIGLANSSRQWMAAWLLASWGGAIALTGTGLWGDYNPALKQFLRQPDVSAVLKSQSVNFVTQPERLNRDGRKTLLLLHFYTPKIGKTLTQPDALQPADYSWLDPNLAVKNSQGYRVIRSIAGWQLAQRR